MKTILLPTIFTLTCIQTACSNQLPIGNYIKNELIESSMVGAMSSSSTLKGMSDITKPYDIQIGKSTLEEAKKLLLNNGWETDEENYKFDAFAKFRSIEVPISGYHFYRFYNSNNEDGIVLSVDGSSTV